MINTSRIKLKTRGSCDIVNITAEVENAVAESELDEGTATVFVPGSTASVTTIEYESGLIADFKEAWNALIPDNRPYQHDQTWGERNGFSHIRASLLGPSLSIPFVDRRLVLGTWQQIVFIDFDSHPRSRELVIQIAG